MVQNMSLAVSGRTYRGSKAKNYEKRRRGQGRWRGEHAFVEEHLPRSGTVLDVPCGTGRFFHLYAKRGLGVIGADVSEEMLELAAKAVPRDRRSREYFQLVRTSVLDPNFAPGRVDVVVCVRLLHLVSQRECGQILRRLFEWGSMVILTVRLQETYRENSSSTTMPQKWFRQQIGRCGHAIDEERTLSSQGWTIMRTRRQTR